MTKVVISQPMYFPWYGHLEQIKHCDIYIFYDDVQFSKGSFFNRIQLKSGDHQTWMTVPLVPGRLNEAINERIPHEAKSWREAHIHLLTRLYKSAPFFAPACSILENVLENLPKGGNLASLSELSTIAIAKAFEITHVRYLKSSELDIKGSSTHRVLDICSRLDASEYITGHGAKKYLDHNLFEDHGISISYIAYGEKPYPQQGGDTFIPYVSSLDCLANCGGNASDYLSGSVISWKEFLNKSHS